MLSHTVKPLTFTRGYETPMPRREASAIYGSCVNTHTLWPNHVLLGVSRYLTQQALPKPQFLILLPYTLDLNYLIFFCLLFVKRIFQTLYSHCPLSPPALHSIQIRPENNMILIPFKTIYAHGKKTQNTGIKYKNRKHQLNYQKACICLLAYYQSLSLDSNPVCIPNAWIKAQHSQ